MNSEPKEIVDIFCEYLLTLLGLPYHWGGDDPMEGFDCSGIVIEAGKAVGLFPRGYDANAQSLYDKYKMDPPILQHQALKGDLVFFGRDIHNVSHVGVVIFPGKSIMIEAGGGKEQTVDLDTAKKDNAFIRLRPYRIDKIGFGDLFSSKLLR